MKHLPPVTLPVAPTQPAQPRKPPRTQIGQTFMFGEENSQDQTAPVGTATDGHGRRDRQPAEQKPGSPAQSAVLKVGAASAPPPTGAPRLDLGADALRLFLADQEADEAAEAPKKPVDPDEEW